MDMINEIGRWLQEKEVLPTALERLGMADKLVLETSALRVRVQVPPPAPS